MLKALLFGSALSLTAVSGVWFSPAAHADKVKDCGTTITDVSNPPSPNAGFTQEATVTQTSACNSNSDTGEEVTPTGDVTNKGGGTPNGH